ncbi:hypothetical protein BN2476_100150 [Paraburkholderia piptadeniae]|uniref:Uncharacterized protein n=1 Tax=Paraburkholderia piptadeniae TaxID=1701573 RepID=A0A1N7RP42_9BURK|nr:hypothetical protein BN2476_100150 [Paraburkholderia piptadeniae]
MRPEARLERLRAHCFVFGMTLFAGAALRDGDVGLHYLIDSASARNERRFIAARSAWRMLDMA